MNKPEIKYYYLNWWEREEKNQKEIKKLEEQRKEKDLILSIQIDHLKRS